MLSNSSLKTTSFRNVMASQGTEVVCSNNSFANESGDATLKTVQEQGNRMYLHRWHNINEKGACVPRKSSRSFLKLS